MLATRDATKDEETIVSINGTSEDRWVGHIGETLMRSRGHDLHPPISAPTLSNSSVGFL